MKRAALILVALAAINFAPARAETQATFAPPVSLRPAARTLFVPETRWSGKRGGDGWAQAGMGAAGRLADIVPADITTWCPGYVAAEAAQRRAFWVGLLSEISVHESNQRVDAVGSGRYFGLLQISLPTARGHDCGVSSGNDLLDGGVNVACGVHLLTARARRGAATVGQIAGDWGPMSSESNREHMAANLRDRSYCAPVIPGIRPVARPANPGSRLMASN